MAHWLTGAQTAAEGGHVYIIAEKNSLDGYTGYYKIGKTKQDLSERLRDLQTGNPHKLEYFVTGKVWNIDAAERAVHAAATKRRFKVNEGGGTQWYFVGPNHQLDLKLIFSLAIKGFLNQQQ